MIEIFHSNDSSPFYNLAKERTLFEYAEKNDATILFFWINDRSIILGKNQDLYSECNLEYVKKNDIDIARRITGGGAVYHDLGNLNYTFITKRTDLGADYFSEIVCASLIKMGIDAVCVGRNDIEVDGKKVSGTALYYENNHMLFHGCIMVSTNLNMLSEALLVNENKYRTKGIPSVRARVTTLDKYLKKVNIGEIKKYIEIETKLKLGIDGGVQTKTFEELYKRDKKIKEKIEFYLKLYSSDEWIYGKRKRFNIKMEKCFLWGDISLEIKIDRGYIENMEIYTDSIEIKVFDLIKDRLIGKEYRGSVLIQELKGLIKKVNSYNERQIISDMILFLHEVS